MKNRISRFENILTIFVVGVFCSSTLFAMASILWENQQVWLDYPDETYHFFLFVMIAAMGCSGCGIITLLVYKIRSLQASNRQEQHVLAMLESRIAAIEAAGDGIGIVDNDGNLNYMNAALIRLHGIACEEKDAYIGRPWESLYNEKGQAAIKTFVLPAIESKGSWEGQTPLMRKDGEVRYTEMSLRRLPGGGFIGTARDVTDQKKAQDEKEQLQKQFYHAQRLEAVGRLAGGIAHDFNNLLSSILGYGEFLIDDLEPQSRQSYFARQIVEAGIQARNLVDQILTFSRQNESPREVINLSQVVTQTAEMLKVTLPVTIRMKVNASVETAPIYANTTQVSQILMNLCINARDAMEGREGRLSIKLEHADPGKSAFFPSAGHEPPAEKSYVMEARIEDMPESDRAVLRMGNLSETGDYFAVTVSDTGGGIDRNILEHIFEPFFTTKGLEKGTGLGLSTVLGMMAAYNGALLVDSRLGKGADFTLFFPVAAITQAVLPVSAAKTYAGPSARRLLVVEDQEAVSAVIQEMLSRLGFSTDIAASGPEAIDMLRERLGEYDLLISDYMMPHMNGLELAEEVFHDFPALPVIIVTGFSDRNLFGDILPCPSIRAVLSKPLDINELSREISAIFAQDGTQAS